LALGRDRDPFDRTILALRERLATIRPLQGAALSINAIALSLNVSQTPVREALATLAGEGLIIRTSAGYAGATHDPESLARLYDLAELLAARVIQRLPDDGWPPVPLTRSLDAALAQVSRLVGDLALNEAHRRVAAQLVPFAQVADAVLRDQDENLVRFERAWGLRDRAALLRLARLHHQRRRRAAGRVLAAAVGFGQAR
jgi:DNA-binding Lrp family transcriptional regulator